MSFSNQPTVSVIIPCRDNAPFLDTVLTALRAQSIPPEEIICVDDNSAPLGLRHMSAVAKGHKSKIIQLPCEPNKLGRRSQARQLGTLAARGDVVLYLDGDMVVGPGYIKELKRLHALDSNIMLKGRRYELDYLKTQNGTVDILHHVETRYRPNPVKDDIYRSGNDKIPLCYLTPAIAGGLASQKLSHISRRTILRLGLIFGAGLAQGNRFSPKDALHMPHWDYCASNNLSVRRCRVLAISGWDCNFRGWGEEDMDFAYRLYLSGVQPLLPQNSPLYAYHLDHPVDRCQQKAQLQKNAQYFIKKFPEMTFLRRNAYDNYGLMV